MQCPGNKTLLQMVCSRADFFEFCSREGLIMQINQLEGVGELRILALAWSRAGSLCAITGRRWLPPENRFYTKENKRRNLSHTPGAWPL